MTAGQLDQATELLHEELHHPQLSIGFLFLDFMLMLAKNPFYQVGMSQKVPYMPTLVSLGPKLWSVTPKTLPACVFECPLINIIKRTIESYVEFILAILYSFLKVAHN